MARHTQWTKLAFPLLAAALVGCASSNPYMMKDTTEYGRVTQGLIGNWAVTEYRSGDALADGLAGTFEKAQVSYDFDTGRAQYVFWVSGSKLREKMRDWRQKWPDLTVDEYKVVLTAAWRIDEKGDALELGDLAYELVIRGSGENFEGFYDWERSKFDAASNAQKGASSATSGFGGLVALAVGKVADTAAKRMTGTTDLFVAVSDTSTFRFGGDGTLLLCGKGDGTAYHVDVTSCEERIRLRRAD